MQREPEREGLDDWMLLYWIWEIIILLIVIVYVIYFINRIIQIYMNRKTKFITNFILFFIISIIIMYIRFHFPSYAILFIQIIAASIILELLFFWFKKYKYYTYLHTSGVFIILVVISLAIYNDYRMQQVVQTTYNLTSDKIDTLTILQIADLHMSDAMNLEQFNDYAKQMNDLDIDLILLTGDIFEEKTSYKEIQEAAMVLGQIQHNLGIYYVYGNHDSIKENDKRGYTSDDIKAILEYNNIVVLEDEIVTIDNITIIGRKDIGLKRQKQRADIEELLESVNLDTYVIVLDHQPLDVDKNASLGVDLQLSGHTHGGPMYRLAYLQSIFTNVHPYGKKSISNFTAITSSGISFSKQTGAPNEYVYIVINP